MRPRATEPAARRRSVLRFGCLVLLVACTACARDAAVPTSGASVRPAYDPATGRLTELALDADGDARFEFTAHMDGRVIRRVDVDENGDGMPERREHYALARADGGGAAEPGLTRVEQFDATGAVRRREGYDAGQLTWAEEDRDGDGTMDRSETWASGALTSVTIARAAPAPPLRIVYPALPAGPTQPAATRPGARQPAANLPD
jgi:hypothetical protein